MYDGTISKSRLKVIIYKKVKLHLFLKAEE